MPSLKMKTKPSAGCLKENNALQVCRKSNMISKNSLSRARVSPNAEEVSVQSKNDDPVCDKVYAQDGVGEGNPSELSHKEAVFQNEPLRVTEVATDSTEPNLSTSPTSLDMIFSPILESIGLCNNEGSDILYVPQLDSEDSDDISKKSSKYEPCNVSDFYISDIIFSASPIGSSDTKTDTFSLPDYQFEESSLLCDLSDEYMGLPFLEGTSDIVNENNSPLKETNTDADISSNLYMEIHQLRSCDEDSHINSYSDQDYDYLDPQMYIRNLPYQTDTSLFELQPPKLNNKQSSKQITLVLDLDETLVHSTMDHCDGADFSFPVFLDMKERTVYVKQRPHLMTFLKRVAEMFEIVVFTASQSVYAKQLLDILDPNGKVISRRAYRESCTVLEGTYTKDLTILGVDLAKVAIIDNSPQVFRLQVDNGIPIQSWFDDPSDTALITMLPFLETLVDADDVRPIIARKFSNKE